MGLWRVFPPRLGDGARFENRRLGGLFPAVSGVVLTRFLENETDPTRPVKKMS
ncbi:hypothetical protein BLL52_4321 [Rhodoferax antarcticus ANT.BR]|uniref:Uncharacterized protein n=1 Tax=Rhodoferax antarcticus ANT.BR TaxID=1111071 RepID=A0A1Q8Y8U6_9BURK|nr:hypothetical protein BLL52_4321 [Rhodoferax antarcticus ANT.BR]